VTVKAYWHAPDTARIESCQLSAPGALAVNVSGVFPAAIGWLTASFVTPVEDWTARGHQRGTRT